MSTEGYLVIGCNLGCWTNYRAKGQWPSRRGHTLGHAFLANAQADGPTAATCPRRWAHHRHAANGPTVTEVWERAIWDESHEGGDHGLRDKDVGRQAVRCGTEERKQSESRCGARLAGCSSGKWLGMEAGPGDRERNGRRP